MIIPPADGRRTFFSAAVPRREEGASIKPEVILHNSVSLDGRIAGFQPRLDPHYGLHGLADGPQMKMIRPPAEISWSLSMLRIESTAKKKLVEIPCPSDIMPGKLIIQKRVFMPKNNTAIVLEEGKSAPDSVTA
jgi:hypothetical protein